MVSVLKDKQNNFTSIEFVVCKHVRLAPIVNFVVGQRFKWKFIRDAYLRQVVYISCIADDTSKPLTTHEVSSLV